MRSRSRYLAERAHQVVSSEELIGANWTVRPANHYASVGQCIREIRQALGGDARWVIETFSGRGYAFKAEVVTFDPSQPGIAALNLQVPRNDEHAGDGLPPDALPPSTPPLSHVAKPAIKSDTFRWRRLLPAAAIVVLALGATGWLLRLPPPAPASDL